MTETPHTFAGNPLDRGEALRRDEDTLAQLEQSGQARFLPFHRLKVATADNGLQWTGRDDIADARQTVFLGIHNEQPMFAADLPSADSLPFEFTDCRLIAASLPTEQTGIVAQARAQLDWHQRNPFCAQCGQPTHPRRGGQIRYCPNCDKHTFPRTDPVAIMLVVDEAGGDRCLLGKSQGRMASTNFYSALAGFLDQGESLEEAVRREVWEEAGIRVGKVVYHSSQPWPFPSQLMIGCHALADTHDIQIDPVEMADVSWFTRAQAQAALEERDDTLRVPGELAIAHHLIRSWVYGEIDI